MSELSEEKASELAKRAVKHSQGLKEVSLESLSEESANNIFRKDSSLFVKIERWHGMRDMMYLEPVLLENVELEVRTPELLDYGIIDGYIYRIFEYVEGQSLDTQSEGKSFYDLEREDQKRKLREIGKNLAKIHRSKEFNGYGKIQTFNGEITGASSDNWFEGLRDVQKSWHEMLEDEDFKEVVEGLEELYRQKKDLLNTVESSKLLHKEMDFRNLIFTDEGLVVVDWEAAAAGDPLMDLAILETVIFWLEKEHDPELEEELRDGYRSVRPLNVNKELYDLYRTVELSRLLFIFHEDGDRKDRIYSKLQVKLDL